MFRGFLLGMWMIAAGLSPTAGSAAAAVDPGLQSRILGTGEPALMFPGLGCPGRVWNALAERLAKDHQVHVIEIPGFAGNAPLARDGALLPALEVEVGEYIEKHHLKRPILIGHSFGGFFSTWLATRASSRYGAVISLDGVPFYSALFDPAATVESSKAYAEQMRAPTLAMDQPSFAAQQNYLLTAVMIKDSSIAQALSVDTARSDRNTFADAMSELMTTDLRPVLGNIKQPMLLIGALGALPDAAARERAGLVYRAQIADHSNISLRLAEQARHFVQYDDPEWLEREVLGFLAANATVKTK